MENSAICTVGVVAIAVSILIEGPGKRALYIHRRAIKVLYIEAYRYIYRFRFIYIYICTDPKSSYVFKGGVLFRPQGPQIVQGLFRQVCIQGTP